MADDLLKRGADPNAVPGADGKYALHWATIRKDTKLVERLLLGKADVSKGDDELGESPLFLALRDGEGMDILDMLLKKTTNIPLIKRNACKFISFDNFSINNFYNRTLQYYQYHCIYIYIYI